MKKFFTLGVLALLAVATVSAQGYRRWDFTNWSPTTVANLMADEGWSDIEKAGGTAPTDLSRDNCFWEVTAAGTADGATLMANGAAIGELEGLLYTNTTSRSLAIAVNYGDLSSSSAGFGPYHGPSYLWMGSSKKNYFIIPSVQPGTVIKMGVESHKLTDARGVNLYLGHGTSGTQLLAPDGSSVSAPKEYTEQEWLVPTDAEDTPNADGTYDIQIYNTNGCHIYYIEVGDASQKSRVGYLYNGSIDDDLGYIYVSGGDQYDVEAVEATASLTLDQLAEYDAIVISSTVTDAGAIGVLKSIQPFVPTLCLNPDVYPAWGYGTVVESPTQFVIVQNSNHALFRDLSLIEEEDIVGIDFTAAESIPTVQLAADGLFAADVVLGTPMEGEGVAIHGHNLSRNAYLYIPYTQLTLASAGTPQLLVNAVKVLAATKAKVTQAPKPTITLDYKNMNTNVSLKSTVAGAQIFYTLDGTAPSEQSTRYTEPINVSTEGVTVKAVAIGDGYLLSDVAELAVDLRHQVATPGIAVEQQDGYTTVSILTAEVDYPSDLVVYYNYSGSTDKAKSTRYTGPVSISQTGRTIYAFATVDGLVDSELASLEVPIRNPHVRIDVLAHMDANAEEYNGGSTSTAYYFSWGKDKAAYPYYVADDYTVTTDPETEAETRTYNTPSPEEFVDFENGWMVRSRGQIVDWENLTTGTNFGDNTGYNFATVDDENPDFPATKSIINLADKNTTPSDGQGFPYNAYVTTTAKHRGPFDVVANVGSIVKPADGTVTKHSFVIEVAADGNVGESSWQVLGDTLVMEGLNRQTRNVMRSYEGTDEVYVRVYLTGNNSKIGLYDIYIANEGELSKQRLQELAGIEEMEVSHLSPLATRLYDLQGRRLSGRPARGIYIENGRKYVAR